MPTTAEGDAPEDLPTGSDAVTGSGAGRPSGDEATGEAVRADEAANEDEGSAQREPTELRRILEAVIMVAESPLQARLLGELTEVAPSTVETTLRSMAQSYEADGRGFRLVEVAGGWRFQSDDWAAPYVERLVLSGQSARLSAAALETLAIVAYKQPISRAQVAAIRGVNVDGVMRTLTQRGYVAEVGHDPGPGQAALFATTAEFLERLGLNSVDELPSLGDFIPEADVVEMLEYGLRIDAEEPAEAGEDSRGPADSQSVDSQPVDSQSGGPSTAEAASPEAVTRHEGGPLGESGTAPQ